MLGQCLAAGSLYPFYGIVPHIFTGYILYPRKTVYRSAGCHTDDAPANPSSFYECRYAILFHASFVFLFGKAFVLCYHQLHHTFVVQVVSHIDEHLVYKGFPACYDFQSLAIGIEIILLAVVDGYRYVRISAKVFLQDIIVMGIERLAVHDGLQVFTDVIADDDKHVCRVVLRILGKDFNGVPDRILGILRSQQNLVYAGFCIGVEWVLLPRIDNSGFSELPAPFFRRTVSLKDTISP